MHIRNFACSHNFESLIITIKKSCFFTMKARTILVSQPKPTTETSPYFEIAKNHKVKIDFNPFIKVEGVTAKEVRIQKIDFSKFTAVILTSKNAVDNYFRLAEEMRFSVPNEMKYFCVSEAIALYLQRYIVYRKRKIYAGEKEVEDLLPLFKKHPDEKFLLPTSDALKENIPTFLDSIGVDWTRVVLYKTVHTDLKHLKNIKYDILVFFSPIGIASLFENFPTFKQNGVKIAAFGQATIQAAKDRGLEINIPAPTKECPSMTMALDCYLKNEK